MNRTFALVPAVFVLLAVLLLPGSAGRRDKAEFSVEWGFSTGADFVIGVLPYRSDEEIQKDLNVLVDYLSIHLQRPVKLNVAVDYHSLSRLLAHGKIQMAWFSHALFEQSAPRQHWEILCRPIRADSGTYVGVIVVREESGINSLSELSGKRFAYVDRLSGSGFLYPARMFREIGMDPVASFSQVLFTGNHSRSSLAVLEEMVDGAAIFCDSPASGSVTVDLPEGLRAIAITEPIPGDPLAVSRDLDQNLKQKLKDLLINMPNYASGSETLKGLSERRGFSEFIAEP